MVPEYGTDYDSLYNMADEAMYRTKKNGKHGYTVYTDSDVSHESANDPAEELFRIRKIIEERHRGSEPLVLGTEAFSTVFQFVQRFNGSYNVKALILLFIVTARKTADDTALGNAAASFAGVLKKSLRNSDIVMQSKNNQFFVLLPMLQEPDAEAVIGRILSAWKTLPENTDFEIMTASEIL